MRSIGGRRPRRNRWKKTEAAGRIFTVDSAGATEVVATGLAWRNQVCQQVFEEAAVDCARALAAWSNSRNGQRRGKPVGFPRFKRKNSGHTSFRLRNRHRRNRQPAVRIGEGVARSVKLPGVGVIRVHDDTRPLRRLLANNRAEIRYATVSYRGGRWWVSLNVEAADLHPAEWHRARESDDHDGWVGVGRGLSTFLVAATADGCQVARIDSPPRASANGLPRQRRLAKALSRKQKGSQNRKDAVARLRRHHRHVRNVRDHFLHQVSNELVRPTTGSSSKT